MAKESKKTSDTVEKAIHKQKEGTLTSGKSGKKVTSHKQAVAIGLNEAREKGAKVPTNRDSTKSDGRKSNDKKTDDKKKDDK